jgi:hypothetical protein
MNLAKPNLAYPDLNWPSQTQPNLTLPILAKTTQPKSIFEIQQRPTTPGQGAKKTDICHRNQLLFDSRILALIYWLR